MAIYGTVIIEDIKITFLESVEAEATRIPYTRFYITDLVTGDTCTRFWPQNLFMIALSGAIHHDGEFVATEEQRAAIEDLMPTGNLRFIP